MRTIEDKKKKDKKEKDVFANLTSKKEKWTTLNLKIPAREKKAVKELAEKINEEENPIVKATQVQLMMVGFKLLKKELEKTPYHKILSRL